MNALTLVQTSPPSNPDRMLVKCTVTGSYTDGTADPLPLNDIADPGAIGVIPNVGVATNPPAVTPGVYNSYTPGYTPVVERTVSGADTTFGLRWFAGGTELTSEAFPAAILNGEIFLEILVNLPTQQ
jgi:hypothetical protein